MMESIGLLMAALQAGTLGQWITAAQNAAWVLGLVKSLVGKALAEFSNRQKANVSAAPVPVQAVPSSLPPGSVIVYVPPGTTVTVTVHAS